MPFKSPGEAFYLRQVIDRSICNFRRDNRLIIFFSLSVCGHGWCVVFLQIFALATVAWGDLLMPRGQHVWLDVRSGPTPLFGCMPGTDTSIWMYARGTSIWMYALDQ